MTAQSEKFEAHLKITEQVLKGDLVGDDGALPPRVQRPHQGEGQVQDVAVEERRLLLVQHGQQLQTKSSAQ